MPAEKLTLKRFIHIIILLIILIIAFIWRTVSVTKDQDTQCNSRTFCVTSFKNNKVEISSKDEIFTITITKLKHNSTLSLSIEPDFNLMSSEENQLTFINQVPIKDTLTLKSDSDSLIIHLPNKS